MITDDGLVLTNAHVVEGARSIEVDFADGRTAEARLIGAVPENDVALVKAEDLTEPVTPAELGASGDLQVGDDVVAIGNALNLGDEPSVTTGIVSALSRSIRSPRGDTLDRPDPDRRGDQPRQLRRAAGQHRRSGGRDQHRDPRRCPEHRLRDCRSTPITALIDDLQCGREVAGARRCWASRPSTSRRSTPASPSGSRSPPPPVRSCQKVQPGSGADSRAAGR